VPRASEVVVGVACELFCVAEKREGGGGGGTGRQMDGIARGMAESQAHNKFA